MKRLGTQAQFRHVTEMRFIDIPPTYLLAALFLAYWTGALIPLDLGPGVRLVGSVLFYAGLALIALAALAFLRAKTSFIPRDAPNALITGGIFRLSRNPIYLGDALILAGLTLRWDAALALPLVPLFVGFIQHRFIRQEEQTLRDAFPDAFADYLSRTRRWI